MLTAKRSISDTMNHVIEQPSRVPGGHLLGSGGRPLRIVRLGRRPYREVWNFQRVLVRKRQRQLIPDTFVLVEHEPVYTLGKNADANHLLQSRRRTVPVYRIERGGDVTYHGPGQVVGYPILDLHDHQLSVSWYMRSLEDVVIQTLAHFGILADRRPGMTGVWVGEEKIAALGVRLSRWVSMHGFALNVNTDLSYFDGIIPCGIFQYGVTSMSEILGKTTALSSVEMTVIRKFAQVFGFSMDLIE